MCEVVNGVDVQLRRWTKADSPELVVLADDPDVARYLSDRFPQPYTQADAAAWLEKFVPLELQLAIECDGRLAGAIGGFRQAFERRVP